MLSYVQTRKGPNKPGIGGIILPLADAFKLFFKENVIPYGSNFGVFIFAPMLRLTLAFSL